jgi:hypothetical protein
MNKSRVALFLALVVGVFGAAMLVSVRQGETPTPTTLPASYVPAPDSASPAAGGTLNGIDLNGLSPEQVATVTKILNDNRCNCNCGMTLAECRVKDPNCSRSLTLGKQVVQDVRDGKDVPTIQKNLNATMAKLQAPPPSAPTSPPDPNKVFKIDTTGSPGKGAKTATVTMVEFSDFQ